MVGGPSASVGCAESADKFMPVVAQAEVWIRAALLVGGGTPSVRGTEAATEVEGASEPCCNTQAATSELIKALWDCWQKSQI